MPPAAKPAALAAKPVAASLAVIDMTGFPTPSYLRLLDFHVRWRCTMTNGNSEMGKQVGTLPHCCHVLNTFTDRELQGLVEAAKGMSTAQNSFVDYKEIQ